MKWILLTQWFESKLETSKVGADVVTVGVEGQTKHRPLIS